MTHASSRSLCATAAVSAVLALGSTPLFAQDAAPSLALPDAIAASPPPAAAASPASVSPPAQTTPTAQTTPPAQSGAPSRRIDLPPELIAPSPAVAPPQAQPVAVASSAGNSVAPAAPERKPSAAARSATADTHPAAAKRAPAPARQPEPAPAAAPAPVVAEAAPPPAAVPSEAAMATAVRQAAQGNGAAQAPRESDGAPDPALYGLAGLLAAGALAGFLTLRPGRRRTRVDDDDAPLGEGGARAPVDDAPRDLPPTAIAATATQLAPRPAAAVPERREAFVMPAGPVPWGEARAALLHRMIAAPPDEANPFTSPKARRRRARIILQSREITLREEAQRPFDWRTYRPPTESADAERRVPAEAG